MVENSKQVQPDKIVLGRELRALTQVELASQSGISQATISKLEGGLAAASSDHLRRLADALDLPEEFFFQTDPVFGGGPSDLYHHRKRQSVSAKAMRQVYALSNKRRMELGHLLRSVEISCRIPRFSVEEYGGRVDEIAQSVRAAWMLPAGPIENLTGAIEAAGGVVVMCEFSTPKVDAISQWLPGLPPVFFVNSAMPRSRCRLTLAHELGHMVMHGTPRPAMEDEANQFAAEFLMPAKEIRPQLRSLSLQKLASLKLFWKTSMAAILKHASRLKQISADQATRLWKQLSARGFRKHEPLEMDLPLEQPTLLQELVALHLNELGHSPEDIAKLVSLNAREVAAIYLGRSTGLRLVSSR